METSINKRGLASGIIVIVVILFVFGLFSGVAMLLWDNYATVINDLPNETASDTAKEKALSVSYIFDWGDKLFVLLFIVLLVSYLISAVTIPVDRPIYIIFFIFVLIIVTILSMVLSNAWTYALSNTPLSAVSGDLKFTDFFMRYFPIITFFTGIAGAVLFYGRRTTSTGSANIE